MKNEEAWKESKFVVKGKNILASKDSTQLGSYSWLVASCVAQNYQKAIPLYCQGKLLDLGCGKVPLYAAYRKFIDECTCVDWLNSLHSGTHVDIECDLNSVIPIENEKFDTILLSDVLEHIYNPHHLFSECRRLLKSGGHILLNVPFYYWIHEAPYDYYRFTKFTLQRMAEENGFRTEILEPVGGALEVFADLTAKLVVFIPIVGRFFGFFIQKTVWYISSRRVGKRMLIKTADNFPLGYFCVFKKIN